MAVLILSANTLWAQTGGKALELYDVTFQSIKAVSTPEAKLSPVPDAYSARDNAKHTVLYAADGTVITIDHRVAHGSTGYEARPVSVSVTNRAFTGRNSVRVVLVNYYDQGGFSGEEESRDQLTLGPAGAARYAGQVPGLVLTLSLMGKKYTFKQVVNVEVDGKWLICPQTNTRDFQLKMAID